nr:hypothetical protein [uncultured Glaciecola sp.]
MAKLNVTAYVVIMLILFQSFTAVASSLDFHSVDVSHLSEVHDHDKHDAPILDKTPVNVKSTSDSAHNPSDCHHCGHCHGSHTQWVGDSVGIRYNPLDQGHAFFYLSKIIDAPLTRLLRPPKFTS